MKTSESFFSSGQSTNTALGNSVFAKLQFALSRVAFGVANN